MQLLPLVERAGRSDGTSSDSGTTGRSASDTFAALLSRQASPLAESGSGDRSWTTAQGAAAATAGAASVSGGASEPVPGTASPVEVAAAEVSSIEQTLAASHADDKTAQALEAVTPPPSIHSMAGKDTSPGKVRVTGDDLEKLKPSLLKNGLSSADMDKLAEQAASQVGLTWAQLVSFVNQKVVAQGKTVEVSRVEKQYLESFFGKVGFTPQQSTDLVSKIATGKGESVLREVQDKLKNQPQDGTVAVAKEEIQSLGRVLGFSKDAQVKLNQYLSLTNNGLSVGDLGKAVSMMQQEAALARKDRAVGLDELKTVMSQTLAKAKESAIQARQASNHEDTKAKDLLLLAAAAKEARGEGAAEEDLSLETARTGTPSAKAARDTQAAGRKGDVQPAQKSEQQPVTQPVSSTLRREPADADAKRQGAGREDQEGGAWKELAAKVRVDGKPGESLGESGARFDERLGRSVSTSLSSASAATTLTASTTTAASVAGSLAGATAGVRPELAQEMDKISRQEVLRQVQNGLLTRVGQGGKQLTLELEPDGLGKVNVMLQVQGKDVRAVIRTENEEVGRMLGDQLDAIKKTLESQGLKVAGVEVQTGLAQNGYADLWQGQDQERQANEEALAKMMARHRQSGQNGQSGTGANDVVRVMQNNTRQAQFSRSAVDIFA